MCLLCFALFRFALPCIALPCLFAFFHFSNLQVNPLKSSNDFKINVNKAEHILHTRTRIMIPLLVFILHRRYTGPQLTSTPIMLCYKRKAVSKIYYPTTMSKMNKLLEETARTLYHTVHPDTINAERSSKRGYKQ